MKHPISKFDVKKINVIPETSSSKLYYHYKSEDIENIKNLNLDLLIRGGSGILKGEILSVCRLGIISFHHGDNDFYRGGPPGFGKFIIVSLLLDLLFNDLTKYWMVVM